MKYSWRGEKEIKEVRGEESSSLGRAAKYPVIYRSLHAYRAVLLILRASVNINPTKTNLTNALLGKGSHVRTFYPRVLKIVRIFPSQREFEWRIHRHIRELRMYISLAFIDVNRATRCRRSSSVVNS